MRRRADGSRWQAGKQTPTKGEIKMSKIYSYRVGSLYIAQPGWLLTVGRILVAWDAANCTVAVVVNRRIIAIV
jgi:hypothetical protein